MSDESSSTIRRGRPLETVAEGFVDTSPMSIYLWLLRTTRLANPDPGVHIQTRFGARLGHDGTFVSHIESGRRAMPLAVRDQWFDKIALDGRAVDEYLTDLTVAAGHTRPILLRNRDDAGDLLLVDEALDGASLSPRDWASACRAASAMGMPKQLLRFCRRATDALVTAASAEHLILAGALLQLPEPVLLRAVRETVQKAPERGYQVADVLAGMDGAFAGPLLRAYLRDLPDPWMLRSVAEAMRLQIERGHIAALADDPHKIQSAVADELVAAWSWTARIELANLASSIGAMPSSLERRIANDDDADVRLVVDAHPTPEALTALTLLREEGILATLDRMYGAGTTDPLAHRLAGMMIVGRTRRSRVNAARAIALSPYATRCTIILTDLLRSNAKEIRRTSAQALMYFPPSAEAETALERAAIEDSDPDVRGRAIWSLIPRARRLTAEFLDRLLADPVESARRCAVDLAGAASYREGLLRATNDASLAIAADAKLLTVQLNEGNK